MIGQTLAHYRITAAIGVGGMGEVYRATDTKLGRDVALKVLPAVMASSPERLERFRREAKALAALDHPSIVTVHSVEEADGVHFLTMQLVEGQPLDRLIPEDGLPVARILEIARALAEALAAAHEKGIVHRDLKPPNVMVANDGRVKVLDFGLAKLGGPPEGAQAGSELSTAMRTREGVVMGTVPYMSPEQVSGREVDHRTDLFSLGVILYEMTAGRRPFQGSSSAELASSILRDSPPRLCELRGDLPAGLAQVIGRCLEKNAGDRFASARDVSAGLRGVSAEASALTAAAPSLRPVAAADWGAGRTAEGFWVAVLPFKHRGTDPGLETLAEGLTEEIVTGLSRFSYLRVISSTSTQRFAKVVADVRSVGKELGARYVMEGTLRQAGSTLRVAVQLVDALSGAHLWAETYDRPFRPEEIFSLQDDIAPRIVSTVADWYGVVPHSMSEALRSRRPEELSPYEAVLRSFGYGYRRTPEEHAVVRAGLERAVQQAPDYADAWAMLSFSRSEEYAFGFNVQPDPLERTLQAARRAADAEPLNALANNALARALFFRKEFEAFRVAAERAIELQPMNGATLVLLGTMMAYAGDWEYGCALVEQGAQLNPRHPGWHWFPLFYNAYRKGDYRGALNVALKINLPHFYRTHVFTAAAYGQLGERDSAGKALRELLILRPDFAATAREEFRKWYDSELVEHLIDGLRKAGLAIPEGAGEDALTVPGFGGRPAIAVLPFDNLSGDPEQEYFADGLAEDLITRLSLWRSFPVIARNSSFVHKGKAVDVKKVSADLGVRYVVEGSVRKAGSRVRISAQLIDATTGEHVWAKTHDRELTDVFAVQDEISEAIAASLVGDLQRAEAARAERAPPGNLEAWGLYQRALPLVFAFTPEDCARARALLERAVALDPRFSTALARLAEVGIWEIIFEWTHAPERTLEVALEQARRAVALDPRDAEASAVLSFALMAAHDSHGALEAAGRAVDLNPSMPLALGYHAYHRHIAGHPPEESIELVKRAMRLSPHDPVEWVFYDVLAGACLNAGRFAEGLAAGRRLISLSPNYYWGYLWSAMNAVGLGQVEEARQLVREGRAVKPTLSLDLARRCLGRMAPDVDRRFTEALRQSGLE